ncbi:hypothetical protein B0T19DRAFT_417704 [Cercophora scortea]|uniref:EH domain-containing protein n=1 Tax=Cercophora scortea TaxID=314031 RepID=A0AAE0IYK4_9PEZI|nr:hypothetical protein B0T19DRAFT_417704 [Cercophora scortea]
MQAPDASKQSNNDALSAALKGATLAFQGQTGKRAGDNKPSPKSPNPVKTNNGAALAAAQATRDHSISRPRSPTKTARQEQDQGLGRQRTGGSGSGSVSTRAQELATGAAYSRDVEQGVVAQKLSQHSVPPYGPDGKKASLIAATLAASRSGSPSPNHTGQPSAQTSFTPTRLHSRVTRRLSSAAASSLDLPSIISLGLQPPDTASIPPANSLISLFEGKKGDMDPVKDRHPPQPQPQRLASHPKIRPLTPPRSRSPEVRAGDEVQEQQLPRKKPKPLPQPETKAAPQLGLDHGVTSAQHVVRVTRPSNIDQAEVKTEAKTNPPRERDRVKEPPLVQQPKPNPRPDTKTHVDPPAFIPKSKSKAELRVRADVQSPKPPIQVSIRPLSEVPSPQPGRVVKTQQDEAPTLPPRISSLTKTSTSTAPASVISTKDVEADPLDDDLINTLEHRQSHSSTSSNDTFVSASSTQTRRAQSPAKKELENPEPNQPVPRRSPPAAASALTRSSSYRDITSPAVRPMLRRPTEPAHSSSSLALDSLTDAIMASNLASSRLARPANSQNPPPLPPPRRHHRPHSPLHAQRSADSHLRPLIGSSSGSKSPSRQPPLPQRTGMLQTLRAPHTSLSDDEDARRHMHRHRKKTLGGGKKHAHHEGSRRRWRDEIAPRERRRYEAVWASNRGLFLKRGFGFSHPDLLPPLPPPDHAAQDDHDHGQGGGESQVDQSRAWDGPEADLVVNAVVRDIWSRSRLPADELAEVWDLVDRRGEGALDKQEFVVGMWLIDQRLRGRKIPARVSESVWDSARSEGVRVIVPKVKAKAKGKGGLVVKAKGPRGG